MSNDGLHFDLEPGYRIKARTADYDSSDISAAEVIPPQETSRDAAGRDSASRGFAGGEWTMFYSAWQNVPPGTVAPPHPSSDPNAVASGSSKDFAAASIASDMAGFRSRIFIARSPDGLNWTPGECVIEGKGHGGEGVDAVHAEDMSVIELEGGGYRMYYAACDKAGNWGVASAVSVE